MTKMAIMTESEELDAGGGGGGGVEVDVLVVGADMVGVVEHGVVDSQPAVAELQS